MGFLRARMGTHSQELSNIDANVFLASVRLALG